LSLPPASITWLLNGNAFSKGVVSQVDQYSSVLEVTNLGYDEEGEFSCQATNHILGMVRFSEAATVTVSGYYFFINIC